MLTIIRGIPGSGKTYYAKNNFGGALVLEGDQRFIDVDGKYNFDPKDYNRNYLPDMLHAAFRNRLQHVIVTTSSSHKKSIDELAEVAKAYGHYVRVMWLDYLNGEGLNDHDVPLGVLDRMKHTWQLYPGETYARRVADGYGSSFSKFGLKIVDTPPPWYTETHKASKVIFLDVDGVLNSAFEVQPGKEFDPGMMEQLKKLVDNTNASIVLSSTWGYTKETRKQVADELMKYGLELYANLYQYNNCTFMRSDELQDKPEAIQNWLFYHPEVEQYIILDDYYKLESQKNSEIRKILNDHLIYTFEPNEKRFGLDKGFRLEAEKILGRKE